MSLGMERSMATPQEDAGVIHVKTQEELPKKD